MPLGGLSTNQAIVAGALLAAVVIALFVGAVLASLAVVKPKGAYSLTSDQVALTRAEEAFNRCASAGGNQRCDVLWQNVMALKAKTKQNK